MNNTKSIVAVTNRTSDPLFTLSPRTVQSDKFWRWGEDNMMPYALSLMSRRSTTHRRIINDKADYIAGKGLVCGDNQPLVSHLISSANASGDTLRDIVHRLAFDEALFGNAFLEVVTDKEHSFLALYHHDASKCRVARDSEHIVLHHNWSAFNSSDAQSLPLFPLFEEQADGTLRSILHYKDYEPMFQHYGVAGYLAAVDAAAIAYKTDKWNISRLDNAFQLSGVMMLDSVVDSEAEADRIVRMAEEKFAGNPGQVLFVLRDKAEGDNSRFIPINTATDGDWHTLHTQAENDLIIAHSWFRSLSGLDYSSGFSSERILHEYEVALNTVILPEQEQLLSPIRKVIELVFGIDASSLEIVNRPPTCSKPQYMRIWEARKADGLEYDESDPEQQLFLATLGKTSNT